MGKRGNKPGSHTLHLRTIERGPNWWPAPHTAGKLSWGDMLDIRCCQVDPATLARWFGVTEKRLRHVIHRVDVEFERADSEIQRIIGDGLRVIARSSEACRWIADRREIERALPERFREYSRGARARWAKAKYSGLRRAGHVQEPDYPGRMARRRSGSKRVKLADLEARER